MVKKAGLILGGAVAGIVGGAQVALAESAFTIASADLVPISETITANLAVLLPVGLSIMAIMVGVALIPRIIWKFF